MTRQVSLKPSARRDFEKMPRKAQQALARKIDLLAVDAQAAGEEKLAGHEGLFRIRAGDYRAVYERGGDTIMILRLGDRKEIYKMLRRLR
jgi:mRNA interferase RelE/StbE